jgi:eukaryotic-like serine/threonine-protein kinase
MPDNISFSHSQPSAQAGAMLGRFVLRSMLGKGGQSSVWLAFDPRMEREVAIKVMRLDATSDDKAIAQWLQEARHAGKVAHPNIVQVYEADVHGSQPYLVFEYIAGKTLEQLLQARGALPAPEAVALMMDVLDAIAAAHAAGVVHRDLKPSNVLVDSAGHARVMDFGIAARIQETSSAQALPVGAGTMGYLSPEAANGMAPVASMDIFSAGLILAELLTGQRLLAETDPYRALFRVAHEQLELPKALPAGADDRLRAIVQRAIALDPKQRYGSARLFQGELELWSKSAQGANAVAPSAAHNSTLEFLLRRMRHKSDFPALSDSVGRIQRMASSETESVSSVTNEILKDVALTNKLLRLVNTAQYARAGNISTVSRAVTLVGFNGIRNMALSLVLLEHMQDKGHAAQLKEEFLRALMAASIGGELCPVVNESEEAFIGSMFQDLGRLLAQFYFAEEAGRIRSMVNNQREPVTERAASTSVLGLSYEDLGVGVAQAWGLPMGIQRCMVKPTGAPPLRAPLDLTERIRWISVASNEIADVLLHCDPQDVEGRIATITRKYAQAMGSSSRAVQAATQKARQKLIELARVMEIHVAPNSAAAKLLRPTDTFSSRPGSPHNDTEGNLDQFELQAKQSPSLGGNSPPPRPHQQIADTLSAGIQDITNAMVEDFKLSDILRMILETMFRALEFDRIIFCMRDPKSEMMVGRFGLGQGVEAYVKGFKTHLKAPTPDLFGVVCVKGADTMISDATEERIVQRLPAWYRQTLNAPTFLLLPLQLKGAPFGLIYADKVRRGALELDDKELALLRTLRNQAVMAFKQST